jgi:hypothetical protein
MVGLWRGRERAGSFPVMAPHPFGWRCLNDVTKFYELELD